MAEGVSEELDGVTELEDGSGQGVSSEGVSSAGTLSELGVAEELEDRFSEELDGVTELEEDFPLLEEESPEGLPMLEEESPEGLPLESGSSAGVLSELGVTSELDGVTELEDGSSLLDDESPEGLPFESEESPSGTLSGTSDCSSSSSSIRLELSLGFAWKVRVRTDSTRNSSVEPSFMVTLMSLEKEALLPNKREDVSTLAKSLEGMSFAMALQAQKTATIMDILISVFILSLHFL